MTFRRGFNRLFLASFVCWNLWNFWLVFKQAREVAASTYEAAETVRNWCINFKKSGCPASDPGFTIVKQLDNGKVEAEPPKDEEKCRFYWSMQFPANINCDATFKDAVGRQTLWRECQTRITDPTTILYIEGIPVCVYLVCWALTAAVLWIARGFGMVVGKKRG